MNTWWLVLLGAGGGSLPTVTDVCGQVMAWRAVRRKLRSSDKHRRKLKTLPPLSDYIDLAPESIAAGFHMLLGAVAAGLLGMTGQIAGTFGAVLVGVAGPAILADLGRGHAVRKLVAGQGLHQPEEIADVA